MSDPTVDALLKEFLQAEARARAKGITLEALYASMQRIVADRLEDRKAIAQLHADFAEHRTEVAMLRRDVRRYGNRLGDVETETQRLSRVSEGPDWRPDPSEITGTWQFQQVSAALHEHKSDARWLKRQGIQWVGAAIGAFVMVLVSAIVAFVMARLAK